MLEWWLEVMNSPIMRAQDPLLHQDWWTQITKIIPCDSKVLFLATLMESPEFKKIPKQIIPPDIINKYGINNLIHKDAAFRNVCSMS